MYLDDGVQGNRFFRGWYLTEDFSQEFYKEKGSYVIKSGSHGDITLYPKFVKKYVFDFLFGDATPVWGKQTDSTVVIENNNRIAFGEDSETVILPEVERIYSQFTNWQYMGVDFAQQIKVAEFLSVPRDGYHFVLSPLWNNDKYTLTYNYGYQVYNDKSGEYEDKVETSEFDFYQTVDLPSKVLRTGLAVPFGITDIHSLLTIQQKKEENGSIIQVRRRDYEYFNQDMTHVASVLIQRAKERRNELMMNRSANLLLKELEDEKELSFLVTPLVSEKREWLNTFENTQSDDGIPSEGVLSDSDEDHSETIVSIESQSKRMHLSEDENSLQSSQSSQFSLLPTNQLTNQACHHYSSKSFQNSLWKLEQVAEQLL